MYLRGAIFLTLIFSAGAAFAAWQFEPGFVLQQEEAAFLKTDPALVQAALSEGEAPTEQATPYMPLPEVVALIREGNKRMRQGDIVGARRSYRDALAFGDVAAALVMGRSYDPIYFAKIVEPNAPPEPVKAFEWYQRAMIAGALETAKVRIADLKQYLSADSVPAPGAQ
jgi:TPR repeat protein